MSKEQGKVRRRIVAQTKKKKKKESRRRIDRTCLENIELGWGFVNVGLCYSKKGLVRVDSCLTIRGKRFY